MNPLSLDDLPKGAVALLTELIRIEDAGEALPGWKALGETLGRDPSNLRKSVEWLEQRDLVRRDPLSVSGAARFLLAQPGQGPAAASADTAPGAAMIPLDRIERCDLNPRKTFDPEGLARLAESIARYGILQPPLLRPHPHKSGVYQIANGERRWRAATLNAEAGRDGWTPGTPIRAVVRELTDLELLEVAIAENRDREDVQPLEEAEAYQAIVALREARGETFEAACAAVGEAAGFTGRYVEKRIRLAQNLSRKAGVALAGGRLTLTAAQELSAWPHAIQDNALANIMAGYGGWKTVENIRAQLRGAGLPVDDAIFDPALYDGPVVEDDDGEVYADRALARRLQEEALPAQAERRSADGWLTVVTDPAAWDNQQSWPNEYPGAKAGAEQRATLALILRINPQTLKLEHRHARPASKKAKAIADSPPPAAQPPQGRPAARSVSEDRPSGREEEQQKTSASPYEKRHWRAARTDKTVRLQTAMGQAPIRFAHAVTLCALFSSTDYHGDQGQPCYWMSGRRLEGDDRKIPPAGLVLLCRAASEFHDQAAAQTGIDAGPAKFAITDSVKALPHLLASPALERMFAAAIAAQAGSWCGYGASPGDAAFVIELKDRLGDLVQPWRMSEDWLSLFAIPQIQRIADACIPPIEGEPAPSAVMPKKKAAAVKFVLDHVRRDTSWTPPDMAFTSPAKAETGARKLMNGEEV